MDGSRQEASDGCRIAIERLRGTQMLPLQAWCISIALPASSLWSSSCLCLSSLVRSRLRRRLVFVSVPIGSQHANTTAFSKSLSKPTTIKCRLCCAGQRQRHCRVRDIACSSARGSFQWPHISKCQMLIDHQANVDAREGTKQTALASCSHRVICQMR